MEEFLSLLFLPPSAPASVSGPHPGGRNEGSVHESWMEVAAAPCEERKHRRYPVSQEFSSIPMSREDCQTRLDCSDSASG